jgi:hypothetical protein
MEITPLAMAIPKSTDHLTSWSYPGEANRDPTEMDNRFSTMIEVRRVLWPEYESPQWAEPLRFQQGTAGSLEHFFWAWVKFQPGLRALRWLADLWT